MNDGKTSESRLWKCKLWCKQLNAHQRETEEKGDRSVILKRCRKVKFLIRTHKEKTKVVSPIGGVCVRSVGRRLLELWLLLFVWFSRIVLWRILHDHVTSWLMTDMDQRHRCILQCGRFVLDDPLWNSIRLAFRNVVKFESISSWNYENQSENELLCAVYVQFA